MTLRALPVVLVFAVPAAAQVPRLLPHEGRLLRADGSPERGTHTLTFALYLGPAGGAPEWSETHAVTLSAGGHYAVLLGRTRPLPTFDRAYWLGVTVQGEPEMSPRAELGAAPYALFAADADRLGGDASTAVLRVWSPLDAGKLSGTVPLASIPAGVALSAQLSTPGTINNSGNPVDWSQLKSVPATIADGVDQGQVVFHRHMTGGWLKDNASIFDTFTYQANDRLDLTCGAPGKKQMEVQLVPAGRLSGSRNYSVRIQVYRELLTSDNDPTILLSDGVDMVGMLASDTGNNSIFSCMQGTDGASPAMVTFGSSTGTSSANQRWWETVLQLTPTSTRCLGRYDSTVSPAWGLTFARVINADAALKLVWACNDAGEVYGVYGIEVTVTEEGP